MKTQRLNKYELYEAAQLIKDGEIVAFPTDTVYGLGADATNDTAVKKIFEAKGRPTNRPISVLIGNYKDIEKYAVDVSDGVFKLAENFWPGPLTIVLKNGGLFAPSVTPGINTVGLRMPDNPIALEFIQKSGTPLATPSANTTGRPSPTITEHVLADLDGKISAVIDGGETSFGIESTVLDFSDPNYPILLRPGNISKAQIEEVIRQEVFLEQEKMDASQVSHQQSKHYEPRIPVFIVESSWEHAITNMQAKEEQIAILANASIIEKYQNEICASFSLGEPHDLEAANRLLFQGLRALEQSEATIILDESYVNEEDSVAYMNRLESAANNKSI